MDLLCSPFCHHAPRLIADKLSDAKESIKSALGLTGGESDEPSMSEKASQKAHETKEQAKQGASKAQHSAHESAERAKEKAVEGGEKVKEKASEGGSYIGGK